VCVTLDDIGRGLINLINCVHNSVSLDFKKQVHEMTSASTCVNVMYLRLKWPVGVMSSWFNVCMPVEIIHDGRVD
jgi:hypothetical protein